MAGAACIDRGEAEALALTEAVRRAVDRRAFTYAVQPILDMKSGEIALHELLARFELPGSTGDLIAVAERAGLIAKMDFAAIATAASFLSAAPQGRGLCVNISPRTLTVKRDARQLIAAVERLGALSRQLVLEVTESVEIPDLAAANLTIQALRERGCRVWLDDFGAGFASLPYLQALEVDGVKIDGAYVAAACRSPRDERLLAGLVAFARELNVETTAERIETREEADLATRVGVTFGQGYFFGRPTALAPRPVARGR